MNSRATRTQDGGELLRKSLALVGSLCLALSTAACTSPGAIAPSTIPVPGKYVALGGIETASSCGLMVLVVPLKHPKPLADLIDDMIKEKGGDALIEVSPALPFSPRSSIPSPASKFAAKS
ncbi:MAG: hypothetical protein ACKOCD_01820 [Nitrospiraceae bacterium]